MSPYADPEKRREVKRESERRRLGLKPWRPGGPGRPPKNRGGAMEPQCKPSKGPMRPEHSYDEDGICTACGSTRATFAPRPEPVEVSAPRKPLPKARPGKGASHKPSPAHAAAFAEARSFVAAPKPEPAKDVNTLAATLDRSLLREYPKPDSEDVATIPDPMAATIAALELERDELDVTIATLKRLHGRSRASEQGGK